MAGVEGTFPLLLRFHRAPQKAPLRLESLALLHKTGQLNANKPYRFSSSLIGYFPSMSKDADDIPSPRLKLTIATIHKN